MQLGRWRALLIAYRELNVRLRRGRWFTRRCHHVATEQEIADATESFRAFPRLAAELSSGAAEVTTQIVVIDSPLRSLTTDGECYWPSPDDTRRELDELSPAGSHDSIFIFWPQSDSTERTSIACRGWGLGMGASDWSNGATYAVVGNAPTWMWQREAPGEVWLHEWLHGVCAHFASRGYPMPERDADGAEVHGYVRSSTKGWSCYYRDLMTGNVSESGRLVGIPAVAWRAAEQQSQLSA